MSEGFLAGAFLAVLALCVALFVTLVQGPTADQCAAISLSSEE